MSDEPLNARQLPPSRAAVLALDVFNNIHGRFEYIPDRIRWGQVEAWKTPFDLPDYRSHPGPPSLPTTLTGAAEDCHLVGTYKSSNRLSRTMRP